MVIPSQQAVTTVQFLDTPLPPSIFPLQKGRHNTSLVYVYIHNTLSVFILLKKFPWLHFNLFTKLQSHVSESSHKYVKLRYSTVQKPEKTYSAFHPKNHLPPSRGWRKITTSQIDVWLFPTNLRLHDFSSVLRRPEEYKLTLKKAYFDTLLIYAFKCMVPSWIQSALHNIYNLKVTLHFTTMEKFQLLNAWYFTFLFLFMQHAMEFRRIHTELFRR